jgi:hypothetical protein
MIIKTLTTVNNLILYYEQNVQPPITERNSLIADFSKDTRGIVAVEPVVMFSTI